MKGLAERRKICNRLGERLYPPEERRDARLRAAVEERILPGGVFLDAGCGPELRLAALFAGRARLSVGIDLEGIRPGRSHAGAVGVVGDLERLPFAAESIDLVALRSVLEHLPDPALVFRGLARVLKPGGWVVALAPSRWYYASVIGRLLPAALSRRTLEFVFGPTAYDSFPTYYRANTPRAVARLARRSGLELIAASPCPHPPDYLKFSPALFRLGVLFDRAAASFAWLETLHASFLFLLRRP